MKKRLAGSALIAASLVIAFQPDLTKTGDPQVKQNKVAETATTLSMQIPVTFVETVDGDTMKVKVNGKVEIVRYLLMCIQPYAMEASQRNNQLIRNDRLTLEFEQGIQRDAYGQLLAYVYAYGQSVQETLLKEGLARVAYIMNPPYKYLSIYRKDETAAKRNKAKIWSLPNYVTQWGFNGCAE